MATEKIFMQGVSIKEIQTQYGAMLKISFNCKKFTDELLGYANEKGYVNCNIGKKKEVGKYGDTHYLTLDTWKKEEAVIPVPF